PRPTFHPAEASGRTLLLLRKIDTMLACTTRRRLLVALAAGMSAIAAIAQPRQNLGTEAPPWRPPVLRVAGAAEPVRLQSLRIDVEIAGGVAETRVEMGFFNPNARVLEGRLQFPLADGQAVSGFSLEVDGV